MKKLAIFVEGQTEWLFVEKLLRKIVSSKRLSITVARGIGGEKRARRFEVIKKTEPMITQRFYVQINISAADSRVNSDVWENYSALVAARFEGIVVVRDVPTGLAFYRIPALRKGESFNL